MGSADVLNMDSEVRVSILAMQYPNIGTTWFFCNVIRSFNEYHFIQRQLIIENYNNHNETSQRNFKIEDEIKLARINLKHCESVDIFVAFIQFIY